PRRAEAALRLAVNSFENFAVDKAKHFVPVTPEGYVIGDVILFHLAEDAYHLGGPAPALDWNTYHAEAGGGRPPRGAAPSGAAGDGSRTGSRCRARTRWP